MTDTAAERLEAAKRLRREEVGRRIAYQRNCKDWSQETLGIQIGRALGRAPMTVRQVSRLENGENSVGFDLLDALAAIFGCPPADLVPEAPASLRMPKTPPPIRKKDPSPITKRRATM